MTRYKIEIISKLIEVYTNCINSVQKEYSMDDIKDCLYAYSTQGGVCTAMAVHCADNSDQMRYNWNLMCDIFKKYNDCNSNHWGSCPLGLPTKGFVLAALEYRLEILQEIKSEL